MHDIERDAYLGEIRRLKKRLAEEGRRAEGFRVRAERIKRLFVHPPAGRLASDYIGESVPLSIEEMRTVRGRELHLVAVFPPGSFGYDHAEDNEVASLLRDRILGVLLETRPQSHPMSRVVYLD